jgi:hypothetical protein
LSNKKDFYDSEEEPESFIHQTMTYGKVNNPDVAASE